MNEVIISWDFLGLLAVVFVAVIGCSLGLKARRRARLTDPCRDHVYKTL